MSVSKQFSNSTQQEEATGKTRDAFVHALEASSWHLNGKQLYWHADNYIHDPAMKTICPTSPEETFIECRVKTPAEAEEVANLLKSAGILKPIWNEGLEGTVQIEEQVENSWCLKIPLTRLDEKQAKAHIRPGGSTTFWKQWYPEFGK